MKAIKKILCLVLVSILFLHTNYLVVYFSLYKINNAELTESCCKKIVVNCNAHCYLDEKMNENDGKGSKGISPELKVKITEYIVSDYISVLKSGIGNIYYKHNDFLKIKDHYSEIDHPPQV